MTTANELAERLMDYDACNDDDIDAAAAMLLNQEEIINLLREQLRERYSRSA
jgi:hypothetical protein